MRIRGTATDKLADVIQTLLFVHKTGTLMVQRDGPGDSFEQGTIMLRDGQVIDAFSGNLRGADAFKKLSAWTICHFLFQEVPPFTPALEPQMQRTTDKLAALPAEVPSGDAIAANVPHRTRQFQENMPNFRYLSLSRTHRQLFLLIDGKRSIEALAHLTGRNLREVLLLLADLEKIGLIHW